MTLAQYNHIDTSFYSESLGEEKMVDVYFPPGYDENTDLYYPVIYYLHGWTENQNDISDMLYWTQTYINDSVIEPVIMVCADNSPDPFDGSMYTNSILWGNYDDYMTIDLINWIDSSFRTMPSRNYRALLGGSMGGYGAFRYGALHKDKFRVLVEHASPFLNLTDSFLSYARTKVIQENQPGPPFFYDYNNNGHATMFMFLVCGAFSPNYNTPQTYINPAILEYVIDDYGNYIDTILLKLKEQSISSIIHQLSPQDSVGILFGCGTADISAIEQHRALKDTLDMLGLPYEYYEHTGEHSMPDSFKERALIFIDSLLWPPSGIGIQQPTHQKTRISLRNYPNPFDQTITIELTIREKSEITLSIYNQLGEKVATIFEGVKVKGIHRLTWNSKNLSSGIYFIRMQTDKGSATQKIIKR
ncbi:MAG: T9SS type A sorting domain-containing protein [Bacteroidales bacterium]|nr:T9SS type A sorting domain-containing protein [Bacteroidales bacterium]